MRRTEEIIHEVFVCKAVVSSLLRACQKEVDLSQGSNSKASPSFSREPQLNPHGPTQAPCFPPAKPKWWLGSPITLYTPSQ